MIEVILHGRNLDVIIGVSHYFVKPYLFFSYLQKRKENIRLIFTYNMLY